MHGLTPLTPDTVADLGYRLYLQSAAANSNKVVNFFNPDDFALFRGTTFPIGSTNWEENQKVYKPNANLGIVLGNRTYAYDSGPPSSPYPVGQRCFLRGSYPPFNQRQATDIHESMSFVARPRSKAIGAEPNSAVIFPNSINLQTDYSFGPADSDHSGQFNRRIQQVSGIYKTIFDEIK